MQALALKYRPRQFSQLVGQEMVSRSLSNALDSGRLGHAYLFSGLRGSGKTSTARIFAKALICQNGPNSTPCDVCENCKMANENRHIDIIELDAASHRKIDDVRELIEQSRYAPTSAKFKVFIIDEVHMLTKEAFNALLKTLEEPPAYVKFILATTDPLKLPATVLSRTQHFRFKPIVKSQIIAHLEYILKNEQVPYELGALEILARSGSGSLRDTITLLEQGIIYSKQNLTQNAVASMLGMLDPNKIDEILQIVIKKDTDAAIEIIKELENYDAGTILDELIANLKEKFLNRDKRFSVLEFERFFRIISEAKTMLLSSSDNGFTIAMTIFLMTEAVSASDIDDIIESAKASALPKEKSEISEIYTPEIHETPKNPQESSIPAQKIASQKPKFPPIDEILEQKAKEKAAQNAAQNPQYSRFLSALYERDFELGECFKNDVEFLKFEDGILSLISNAKDESREILRSASKGIMQVLRQIYGSDAKIKIEQNRDSVKKNRENLSAVDKLVNLAVPQEKKPENNGIELMIELGKSQNLVADQESSNLKTLEKFFGNPEIEEKS